MVMLKKTNYNVYFGNKIIVQSAWVKYRERKSKWKVTTAALHDFNKRLY